MRQADLKLRARLLPELYDTRIYEAQIPIIRAYNKGSSAFYKFLNIKELISH